MSSLYFPCIKGFTFTVAFMLTNVQHLVQSKTIILHEAVHIHATHIHIYIYSYMLHNNVIINPNY